MAKKANADGKRAENSVTSPKREETAAIDQ